MLTSVHLFSSSCQIAVYSNFNSAVECFQAISSNPVSRLRPIEIRGDKEINSRNKRTRNFRGSVNTKCDIRAIVSDFNFVSFYRLYIIRLMLSMLLSQCYSYQIFFGVSLYKFDYAMSPQYCSRASLHFRTFFFDTSFLFTRIRMAQCKMRGLELRGSNNVQRSSLSHL